MNLNDNKETVNKELELFMAYLNKNLVEYSTLLKKENISPTELKQLGDIEYFLIEINSKITEIKKRLENDLFGYSLDLYYGTKREAISGNQDAKRKLDVMLNSFNESLQGGMIVNWN
ncbi:MAG: hypothetical protein PHQ74_02255 [Crocinitomicaceae bacterium]|nr:hypothetical protein [Crocinitomicaceae bacterium]